MDKENSEGKYNPEASSQETVEDVLADFRNTWQKELSESSKLKNGTISKTADETDQEKDRENMARRLFLKGIEMEKTGKLYEAILFYRRAVQIIPDIEFKLDNSTWPKAKEKQEPIIHDQTDNSENSANESSEDEEIKEGQLLARIQRKATGNSALCFPKIEQNSTHIGQLPVELMLYIIKWIISADLDFRSLEMFSQICRGFYLCARDPEVWKLGCLRVWGLNCGPTPGIYGSWRDMFIERPRIHYHGCYISKTTYIRHGENSFQDQFYRPWHLITYYRYLRFFPDGHVLMLTTAEEPLQCVSLLKYRNARYPVLSGYYRLKDDMLTLVVKRQDLKSFKKPLKRREVQDNPEQSFHMELQIRNHRRRKHVQLAWTHYSVFSKIKNEESTCNFEIISNRFPPLWFSRVKSFTAESEYPLN